VKISVFGTGEVGTAIARALSTLGHDVVLASRKPGNDKHPIRVVDHIQAAEHGAWVVNAMHGEDAIEVLPALALSGKLLWDLGNFRSAIDSPLGETRGETLQRLLPQTRVVKAMNFVSAQIMARPDRLEGNHTVFIAANDAGAKGAVTDVLQKFGWPDILDLGDLTACRAMESLAPMWIRLNDQLGHVMFDLEVVRGR
jgi:8-hydroxy-5-deazaflavin:NADPH oxidoreductase